MTQHCGGRRGANTQSVFFAQGAMSKLNKYKKTHTHNWATTKKRKRASQKIQTPQRKRYRSVWLDSSRWTEVKFFSPTTVYTPADRPKMSGGLARLPQAPPLFLLDNTHTPVLVLRVEWISIFLSFLQCRLFSSTTPISYVLTSIASSSLAAERIGIPAC
jgi:hypothetical protein